jgi:23S rRNA pseudouridine2457 synthase
MTATFTPCYHLAHYIFLHGLPEMPELILFNKPYGVICQFSRHELHPTLKDHITIPGIYPAGRLDTDSEGLLLLTGEGALQHRISDPRWKLPKTYWVQVEGRVTEEQLAALRAGVDLGDFVTRPAQVRQIDPPACGSASRRCGFARPCRIAGWKSSSVKARTVRCAA